MIYRPDGWSWWLVANLPGRMRLVVIIGWSWWLIMAVIIGQMTVGPWLMVDGWIPDIDGYWLLWWCQGNRIGAWWCMGLAGRSMMVAGCQQVISNHWQILKNLPWSLLEIVAKFSWMVNDCCLIVGQVLNSSGWGLVTAATGSRRSPMLLSHISGCQKLVLVEVVGHW